MFNILFWGGLEALFGWAKPTKDPRGDGTVLNFGILYLRLYYQLVALSRNFLVDPNRRQVGHP